MLRHSGLPIDWRNRLQLRTVTAALCQDLRQEIASFDAGAIREADLKNVYETVYQETTVDLLDALMHYAPAGWGFTIGQAPGGQRIYKSPEYDIAAGPLHASMAATEVGTIVQALEYLVARVPEN